MSLASADVPAEADNKSYGSVLMCNGPASDDNMTSECKVTLPQAEMSEHGDEDNETSEKTTCCTKFMEMREKLCHVIHHHYFQVAVIVLVLFDTSVVVAAIMLATAKSQNHDIEVAEKVLHYISLTILSVFMVEIAVKIFAMGLSFFKHKFEVFDAIIVTVSFFLDIFLSTGGLEDGVEFLILLRLWRITRVINGIIVSIKTRAEEKHEKLHKEIEELKQTIGEQSQQIETQKEDITRLQLQLEEAGLDPQIHKLECSAEDT